ncbi:arginine deiminase-related protein [Dyadobacter sp. CY107]|uniref:citrulline utilization hydrolase CtlX n=1 Tax=Dyadobacter fanqingshengii TaxID=2906443 RepID=UPI001F3643DA|nr:arginine deiminase-related protein [Dyadobacter fanqingshengii]MCF2504590.1 arginine deiminase-related protein [Dyadobacter fanqingshengii]
MRVITSSAQIQPQSTSRIMMIRPVRFGFNAETAESNEFQQPSFALSTHETAGDLAKEEFDLMIDQLKKAGVDLHVFDDNEDILRPDAVFSNNWVSFHQSGKVVLYPMMAENRRAERRLDIIERLKEDFKIEEIIDLSYFEEQGKFLEGTGSMVLDRRYKIAYACLSPRTHPEVLEAFAEALGYEIVAFSASDENGKPVYHTNVIMCVGDVFAVVCLEAIKDPDERQMVRAALEETKKYIVEITFDQVRHFAGNMLMVRNNKSDKFLVMSTQAYDSLTSHQRQALSDYARILHTDLGVIEGNGGGSARCMMTEIHLPRK